MNHEPIEIVRIVRRMRGGSQAHLVEGEDGHFYVAKFMGNPQGTRTLINEWFAHQLFQKLGVSTPRICVLRLTKAILESTEDLVFLQGTKRIAVESGLHLGSQCPVNPEKTAIFDFLPRHVLNRLVNPEDFARVLVLDLFLAQTDSRQAIFVRERFGKVGLRLRAYMIDNGWMLGGSRWQIPDYQFGTRYWNRAVYSLIDQHVECEQALHVITAITKKDLYQFGEDVPRIWFSKGDEADWARLLDLLNTRKSHMPRLLFNHLNTLDLRQPGEPEQHVPDMALLPTFG